MKTGFFLATFLVTILLNVSYSQTNLKTSYKILEFFKTEKFDSIPNYFNSMVKQNLPADKLELVWKQLNSTIGPFINTREPIVEEIGNVEKIRIPCQFGSSIMHLQLAFDQNKVSGIFFLNSSQFPNYKKPSYAIDSLTIEKNIAVKTGKYVLPGVLTLPKKTKKAPIVIFIHGSGPSDMDETLGGTKIFKDLAYGLALNGIASLRYDKRTKKYARQMADNDSLTLKEEVIEDVISAVRLIKDSSDWSSGEIYLLGHSLGGMLIPRIAKLAPEVKGVIMMAANARTFEDVVISQLHYLSNNDTSLSSARKQQLESVITSLDSYKKNKSGVKDEELPLDLPKSYWDDLNNYNQVIAAKELSCKVLVLQGERDYQVTMDDFNIWKKELKDKKNVIVKSYPTLNHVFISGKNNSLPIEYEEPGNVDISVIEDISKWVKLN